ncbi:hypothetical protein [Rhizobium sp. CECT 9324]|uniref:hypothetical protein n=1 Tax=Rhizobium sp. CECT 9324 TaxID=2845820 RepID=UPI001E2E68FB|nr:hypothetical protein [Rhizobium sp. CECT 9324]CAH0343059.1 hypothetical protein RHI9324_04792 [Rhizobium sp. CECT 9324]
MRQMICGMAASLVLLVLSSCTFQSDTVLWATGINSDEVEGLSSVRISKLSGLDPQKGTWQVLAEIVPHRDVDGLSFLIQKPGEAPEETKKRAVAGTDYSVLFFKKLGPGRYVVRHAAIKSGKTEQTGIGFLSAGGDRFFLLTGIKDEALRSRTMFADGNLAGVAGDIIAGGDGTKANSLQVTTWEQAKRISNTFHEQREMFDAKGDYAQFMIE